MIHLLEVTLSDQATEELSRRLGLNLHRDTHKAQEIARAAVAFVTAFGDRALPDPGQSFEVFFQGWIRSRFSS